MRKILSGKSGFTLVELLVVTAILGIVITAIYSLYLTHMRAAYTQDEVVEVQQNLRIAMDSITRDLKMAGALVPYGTPPITGTTINTCVAGGAVARINATQVSTLSATITYPVDSADSLNNFATNDTVRIIRPFDGSQPFTNYTTLLVDNVGTTNIRLKPVAGTFPSGVSIKNGDMIAKKNASPQARFDQITYSVASCPAGSGLSESCLYRSVNGGTGDVIASNLADAAAVPPGLAIASLTEDNYGSSAISAVQVTLTGVTRKKASPTDTPKSRQMVSIVKLRNRRNF